MPRGRNFSSRDLCNVRPSLPFSLYTSCQCPMLVGLYWGGKGFPCGKEEASPYAPQVCR